MDTKPLKRHQALQPLSKEHHFALLLCWKIRKGQELNIEPNRIGDFVKQMWDHQIAEHFEIEEKYIFSILEPDNKLLHEALSDHKTIKRLILNEPFTEKSLNRLEEKLEQHIRMEERQLFPHIQSIASNEQLKAVQTHHTLPIAEMPWNDRFWETGPR